MSMILRSSPGVVDTGPPRRGVLAAELSMHPAAHHEHAFRVEAEYHARESGSVRLRSA
jgi:hypothetical protein